MDVKAGFVKANSGAWFVQAPAHNQWGFVLADEDQTYPGGFGASCSSWELVPEEQVPEEVYEELEWVLDNLLSLYEEEKEEMERDRILGLV